MDQERFLTACETIIKQRRETAGIGTLSEKTLHAVLKHYFSPDPETHEVPAGRFVADILCADGIIEIQTRGFNRLRDKLAYFLTLGVVTIVYPVAHTKWISWIDQETGEVTKKRKSPKTGTAYEVLYELYKIKPLLCHPNLRLHVLLIDVEDYRLLNGWSYDKKRGSTRGERIPLALADEVCIKAPAQYAQLIPDSLVCPFTSKDYAAATRLSLHSAQTALNVLSTVGVLCKIGKRGRLHLYQRTEKCADTAPGTQ